jgi:archaellum component FlaC
MSDGLIGAMIFCLPTIGLVAWLAWDNRKGRSSRDWEEFKAKQPTKSDKVDANLQASTFIRLNEIDSKLAHIQGDIASLSNEVANASDDLEAIRRKLHELASDVKRISSVFAHVPTAEAVND